MFNIVGCEMDYVCKKLWSELTMTSDPKVRNCSACMKPVTFCTDQKTLEKSASSGVCVAYLRQERSTARMTMGLPSSRNGKLRTYLDEL
jgi:hypothetical protein